MRSKSGIVLAVLLACVSSRVLNAGPGTERIVIIKADGLAFDILDSFVRQRDPYSGKSVLPWIDYVFYNNGTRLANFYSRGLSLSAQSWSILDSGQPSVVKGNLEFDRLTLQSYDYLNMFSFFLKNSVVRTDTAGMRVLDEQEIPVLFDAYDPGERSLGPQIYLRGLPPAKTSSLRRLLTLQNPKEWFDEWLVGLEGEKLLVEVSERELLGKLRNPAIQYLDMSAPFFDHATHRNRDPEAQLRALQQIDAIVKDLWTAIQETSLASRTALVLVSDHGINTDPQIYSQGYNLIDLFGSAAGGGHHVLTHRPPLSEYSLKSLSPTVPQITTPSRESHYLKGQAGDYPTLLLDADGNERASVYLRYSDLNVLHILWQQLRRKDLASDIRRAAITAFFEVINRNRPTWSKLQSDLQQELGALHRSALTMESRTDELKYGASLSALANLLALRPERFEPSRLNIEAIVPRKSIGQLNRVHELQNYVVGLGKDGLVLDADGSLDFEKSFVRINYFELMRGLSVRNNVQRGVGSRPVDFVTAVVPGAALGSVLVESPLVEDAVWLYKDDDSQALILIMRDNEQRLWLKYAPVQKLQQLQSGEIRMQRSEWRDGLPLAIWESLAMPVDERRAWLEEWHSEGEWLEKFHASRYSNAVVSLAEQFTFSHPAMEQEFEAPADDQLLIRYRQRKRELAQADFIVFANDHWNFNFRGFNPGGNHGSFFRASTHSTLMFAGGNETGIPRGLQIDRPYDSLSLAPTLLELSGRMQNEDFSRKLKQRGWTSLPGPVIGELFHTPASTTP